MLTELALLGAAIDGRLVGAGDARSAQAREAWSNRAELPAMDRLAIETGIPSAALAKIAGTSDPAAFWLGPTANAGEVVAVARMTAGVLDTATLRAVVAVIQGEPRRPTAALDALAELVADAVDRSPGAPHEEGYLAATKVREVLGVETRFDVSAAFEEWGIPVRTLELPTAVDAVCAWGPLHGPVILLNSVVKHAGSARGRRTTLAHELCHLLLDRSGALPVAEVLGSGLPAAVERRARAFAAEVLLPKDVARTVAEAELDAGTDIEVIVRALVNSYDVSAEVVAWQIRNSQADLTRAERHYLSGVVSDPGRY